MDPEVLKIAEKWATDTYFEAEDRAQVRNWIDKQQSEELTESFYKELEFGTGGLRGVMGLGSNRYNRYNVRRATQAVANVLCQSTTQRPKIAVAYDSRNGSKHFAQEVCSVMAANGIQSIIYPEITPVPLLSYSVRYHQAQAGVMITASHNPKIYNGYKLYWSDGAQVTPPQDQIIIKEYNRLTDWSEVKHMPFDQALEQGLVQWTDPKVIDSYFQAILGRVVQPELCREKGKQLKLVYTPIHGTGLKFVTRLLENMHMSEYLVVPEQAEPNGDFPTAETPNPELPETMKYAEELMLKKSADVAMGTDPDTDRLGVIIRHKDRPIYLNGNQLGTLMLHYVLTQLKAQQRLPLKALVFKTIVTSELQTTICQKLGVHIENTLTGFKWMGARLKELEDQGSDLQFIYGNEESFGFLTHDFVRDKDGVSAISLFAEMSLHYKLRNKTLIDALDDIYQEFGFSHEHLVSIHYLGKEGVEKMQRIMQSLRENTPKEICGEKVIGLEDYLQSSLTDYQTDQKSPLSLPQSNVLGFRFESGNKLLARPSGTEPKIKFYILVQEREGDLETKKRKAIQKCDQFEAFIRQFCEEA